MNPARQVPFLGHSQSSAGQRNWKGLGTLRQAYSTPTKKLPAGGRGLCSHSLSAHQDMVRGTSTSLLFCASWGQTQRALAPVSSPMGPSPRWPDHGGKATDRCGLLPTMRVAGSMTPRRTAAETQGHLAKPRACHDADRAAATSPVRPKTAGHS